MKPELPVFSPSDFVAVVNQIFENTVPIVEVEGEVSNFRISKGKWVYFDIKDETASVKCFASIYNLGVPIEDGMTVHVQARPQLHPLYNFSLQISQIAPTGEGSIKKAFEILMQKLEAEGLFDESRKRQLPYPPEKIGLVTSSESAAFSDFMKVTSARWPYIDIVLTDVQVQGMSAADQIVEAIHQLNEQPNKVDVIVIIRGGGSADDLIVFQDERVVRAISGSRTPTLVAIGHERDISLAELAADKRASTPSNAAELLIPSAVEEKAALKSEQKHLLTVLTENALRTENDLINTQKHLGLIITNRLKQADVDISQLRALLEVLNPTSALRRGYALVRKQGIILKKTADFVSNDDIEITVSDGEVRARVV